MLVAAAKHLPGVRLAGRCDPPAHWIDKLTGSTRFRTMIDAGASADEVVGGWQAELAAFDRAAGKYLLYRGRRRTGDDRHGRIARRAAAVLAVRGTR